MEKIMELEAEPVPSNATTGNSSPVDSSITTTGTTTTNAVALQQEDPTLPPGDASATPDYIYEGVNI
jgi:hypothetical protein